MGDLQVIIDRVIKMKEIVKNEEQTKMALIVPFLSFLGYDIYNPEEVIPEYSADFGVKSGEKVDYAISIDGELKVLLEAKAYGIKLGMAQVGQLYRYFSVTNVGIAILTDGVTYKVYSDTIKPNVMDSEPILEFNLSELTDNDIEKIEILKRYNIDRVKGFNNKVDNIRKVRDYILSSLRGHFDEEVASMILKKCNLNYDMGNLGNKDVYLDGVREALHSLMGNLENLSVANTKNTDIETDYIAANETILELDSYIGSLVAYTICGECETYIQLGKHSATIGVLIDDKKVSILGIYYSISNSGNISVWGVKIPGYFGVEAKGTRKAVQYENLNTLERFKSYIVDRVKRIYGI